MSESASTPPKQRHKRKILATFATLALMSSVGVVVTSAAFTATTDNTGNRIEAGSVALSDSDAATGRLYDAPDQSPGAANGPAPHCLRVTYSGSLASTVKLYSTAIANGTNFRLKVERGSGLSAPGSDMNCTGFTPATTAYDATLDSLPHHLRQPAWAARPAAAALTTRQHRFDYPALLHDPTSVDRRPTSAQNAHDQPQALPANCPGTHRPFHTWRGGLAADATQYKLARRGALGASGALPARGAAAAGRRT
jgi:hypothetical protein